MTALNVREVFLRADEALSRARDEARVARSA